MCTNAICSQNAILFKAVWKIGHTLHWPSHISASTCYDQEKLFVFSVYQRNQHACIHCLGQCGLPGSAQSIAYAILLPNLLRITGNQPEWLGVVRSAFAAHDEEPHTLRSSIAMLENGAVAVAARHADPADRLIVDEYVQLENGTYALQQTATELFRCAGRAYVCIK